MHRLKNRGIVVLTVLGLFTLSGIAMADTEDDTVVNHYIDYDEGFLAVNITSLEYSPDYETLFSTLSEDCALMTPKGDEPEDYSISFDGETITVNQNGTDFELGDCTDFIGGYFLGPNGQSNRGMIMKFLNSIYEGPGRGCVIREFAGLEFDKEDQQKADPEFDASELSETLDIEDVEFSTFETNCLRGNQGGNGGPPQHVLQKWDAKWGEGDKPGKPEHAGGRP